MRMRGGCFRAFLLGQRRYVTSARGPTRLDWRLYVTGFRLVLSEDAR